MRNCHLLIRCRGWGYLKIKGCGGDNMKIVITSPPQPLLIFIVRNFLYEWVLKSSHPKLNCKISISVTKQQNTHLYGRRVVKQMKSRTNWKINYQATPPTPAPNSFSLPLFLQKMFDANWQFSFFSNDHTWNPTTLLLS